MYIHLCTNYVKGVSYLYDTDDSTVGSVATDDMADMIRNGGLQIEGFRCREAVYMNGITYERRFGVKYPFSVITNTFGFYARSRKSFLYCRDGSLYDMMYFSETGNLTVRQGTWLYKAVHNFKKRQNIEGVVPVKEGLYFSREEKVSLIRFSEFSHCITDKCSLSKFKRMLTTM